MRSALIGIGLTSMLWGAVWLYLYVPNLAFHIGLVLLGAGIVGLQITNSK